METKEIHSDRRKAHESDDRKDGDGTDDDSTRERLRPRFSTASRSITTDRRCPLKRVANVVVPDPKLITVQPWEKPLVGEIVKAIQTSNLGLNPQSDGTFIRIPLPPLTEERRKELVKGVKHMVEEAKVAIRNVRRDAIDKLKKIEKDHKITEDDLHRSQKEIQDLTDRKIVDLDKIFAAKEKEILEV